MLERIATLIRPRSTPRGIFCVVFVIVSLLVFGASALITFQLPETYGSTARIKIEQEQTELPGVAERGSMHGYDPYLIQTAFEVIQSPVILDKVIEKLKLSATWG